jgi:hypothetical protein
MRVWYVASRFDTPGETASAARGGDKAAKNKAKNACFSLRFDSDQGASP